MAWIEDSGMIIDVFERCCMLPRIFGVYPYVTKGTRIEVSRLLVTYDLVLAFGLNVFDAYMLTQSFPCETKNQTVAAFIMWAQLIMTSVTITLSSIWILRNRTKVQEMIDELIKFEDIVQPKNFLLCNRALLSVLGLLTALMILHFIIIPIEGTITIFLLIRYHLATLMIFSNAAFFTRSARIVGTGYGIITNKLGSMKNIHSMKDIQKAIEHLVSASESLNVAFGPQILSLTSTFFVLSTGNIYMAIMSTSTTSTVACIIWAITFTKLMLHLIHSCNWTSEKAKEMDKEFYRTVLDDKRGELSQQVRMCLHFTNNRKVEFTACGFFTIDYTLAGSMVASATTYLVILIQIGGN